MIEDNQLDVIVRFHDVRRLSELERCVFSLVGQSYRPLHIILALQRFSTNDIAATRATLAPLLETENAPGITLLNWEESYPVDARSVLLNLGLRSARGRYIAFLDYDDVLYPEAYELMVLRLKEHGAAISFATVRVMLLEPYPDFFYTKEKVVPPFSGSNLLDLFRQKFCPLHSYVIDRQRVPNNVLFIDGALAMEEDYDLLLRICAQFQSDFSLVKTPIGEYYFKTDDSNTVPASSWITEAQLTYYERIVVPAIEQRRRTTLVSALVSCSLGLPDTSYMTIRDVLDLCAEIGDGVKGSIETACLRPA